MVDRTFIVQGQDLARITKWAEKATDALKPENGSVIVKIAQSRLSMQAFNGIKSVETATSITQNFPDDIYFSINAQLLSEAVRKMEKLEIKASFERTKLVLTTTKPRMKYILPIHVPRTVAELPKPPKKAGTVDTKTFKNAVTDVLNSVATEDLGSPVLESVRLTFTPQNKTIDLISTNRYTVVNRVVSYEPDPNASLEQFQIFVKHSNLKDSLSNITDEMDIELYAEDQSNLFGVRTNIALMMTLTTNITKAPAIEKFLVSTSEFNMIISKNELALAITNLRSASNGGAVSVGYLNFKDEVLTVESDPDEKSEVGFEMEVDVISHNYTDDFKLKMNAVYLMSVLKASKTPTIQLVFSPAPENRNKPVIVNEVDDNGKVNPHFSSVFMPLAR